MTNVTRNELKQEIAQHFLSTGVPSEKLADAFKAFKLCADEGREFEEFFAPKHHAALEIFQKAYWDLDKSPLFGKKAEMTKGDAEEIFADRQSSIGLLKDAARVLGR